jgi:hypothetical protein
MAKCHQQHNLDWQSISALPVLPGKNKRGHHYPMQGLLWPKGWEERAIHFASSFKKIISEFATTEFQKYEQLKFQTLKEIYSDSQIGSFKNILNRNIFTNELQSPKEWNRILSQGNKKTLSPADKNVINAQVNDLVIIIKELFSRGDLGTLISIARAIKGLGELATYKSGHKRILTDALHWYFYSNLSVLNFDFDVPEKWYVHDFLTSHDYDEHKRVYRELLGGHTKEPSVTESKVLESQKFAFKMIYQYKVFFDELIKNEESPKEKRTAETWRGKTSSMDWLSIEWEDLIIKSIMNAQKLIRAETLKKVEGCTTI